jgi:uncharacterized protein YjiS (DUF1127 family)
MTYTQTYSAPRSMPLRSRAIQSPFALVVVTFAELLLNWDMRHKTRKSLKKLTYAELDDIGLTRAQACTEARRMFWQG